MEILSAGANGPINGDRITVAVHCDRPLDLVAYRLTDREKVRGDDDMVFYNQLETGDGSISHRPGRFTIDLAAQPAAISAIAFAFATDEPLAQLGELSLDLSVGNEVQYRCPVAPAGREEKALILGQCYRHRGQWKFRFIDQGFRGGLKPLSEFFGVAVATEEAEPAPQPTPTPPPTVNLSKVTLDKSRRQVRLEKVGGPIKINLNWNRQPARGFLAKLTSKAVDLDLGAFVRFRLGDGVSQAVVQALGRSFGALDRPPFVRLRSDDRTGASRDGEWLDISGDRWREIDEVLIFAFIYEGVANWDSTDALVTLEVQGQQVLTPLSEGQRDMGMCAVARLLNRDGQMQVERLNRYFASHSDMDRAYGWGFQWRAGSK